MIRNVHIRSNHPVKYCCCPGATVSTLCPRVRHIQEQFDVVVVHVGTNDVCTLTPGQFRWQYSVMTDGIRALFSKDSKEPKILASSVLPRPNDFDTTSGQVLAFNQTLKDLVIVKDIASFCKSYRPFLLNGQVKRHLFGNDGLHLTREGSTLLSNCITGRLSNVMKML